MTDATYKLTLHLSDENMTRFGSGIALLCVEFPTITRSDILDLQSILNIDPIPMEVVRSVLTRMLGNAETVIPIGDALATVVGMCQPERIDGGPVQ
jgi:hypothetical protein